MSVSEYAVAMLESEASPLAAVDASSRMSSVNTNCSVVPLVTVIPHELVPLPDEAAALAPPVIRSSATLCPLPVVIQESPRLPFIPRLRPALAP